MIVRRLRNELTVAGGFKRAEVQAIVGWVDPELRRRREGLRNSSDESLRVAGMSGGQHLAVSWKGLRGLARVYDGLCQKTNGRF